MKLLGKKLFYQSNFAIAASKALDELIPIRSAMEQTFGIEVKAIEIVDTKDPYNTLTFQRKSVYRSIRGDVNVIPFKFETELDVMGWVRGS